MKELPPRIRSVVALTRRWLVVTPLLLVTGCSVTSSFQFDDRVLVKVPGTKIVPTAQAGGWRFRHVVEGPGDRFTPRGQWYAVWHAGQPPRRHFGMPWSRWQYALDNAPSIASASRQAFGTDPTMIEPDLIFSEMAARVDMTQALPGSRKDDSSNQPRTLRYSAAPSPSWPIPKTADGQIRPAWHLGDDYSQLSHAAQRVTDKRGGRGEPIRIGILDNGFSARQAGVPERHRLEDEPTGDALDALDDTPLQAPGSTGASHGTGTIGLLAGRRISLPAQTYKGHQIAGYTGYLGGDPNATIVPVRVAPWVFSLTTANLAYGLDYASRVKRCDVLSLSHGGAPSQVWADAVNAAYERGTAMFAAEGDFFSLYFKPIQPRGIIVPSSPVYPAAFRRVMGVTGATSTGESYAENSLWNLVRNPTAIAQWFSRGSYGPDGSWRSTFGTHEWPDQPTVRKMGILRAYPVAGYSPNTLWLHAPDSKDPSTDRVDLNGAGTSAATPQVAAAAALWLDYHRPEIGSKWNTWEKSEAAYTALLLSAQRDPARKWPDRYLGAGLLKADRALNLSFADVRKLERHPVTESDGNLFLKYRLAPRDFFDGARSFKSLLGFRVDLPYGERADLDQRLQTPQPALQRLFYNTLLLREWQAGRLPRGEWKDHLRQNSELIAQAARLAGQAPRGSNGH